MKILYEHTSAPTNFTTCIRGVEGNFAVLLLREKIFADLETLRREIFGRWRGILPLDEIKFWLQWVIIKNSRPY